MDLESRNVIIKLIGFVQEDVSIKVSYTPDINTYNFETKYMCDDCKPYRVSQSIMIWLSNNGLIGEIESIFPPINIDEVCKFSNSVIKVTGFPIFEIVSCDSNTYLQRNETNFYLWFNNNKIIDKDIICQHCHFLFSKDELVGIYCSEYKTIN